jgi:hypothetical protein
MFDPLKEASEGERFDDDAVFGHRSSHLLFP